MPVPVPMVRARPQRIRLARRSGAACTSARLAAQVKHPLAFESNSVAGSSPQTSPATTRLTATASRSQLLSLPAGQVSAAEPRSAGASAGPASAMVNSSAGRAGATGTAAITTAGPASMSRVPHSAVVRCAASAAPAATAPAAAAACRATCQGAPPPGAVSGYEAASRTIGTPTASTAAAISAGTAGNASDAALPLAFMTGECQRLR